MPFAKLMPFMKLPSIIFTPFLCACQHMACHVYRDALLAGGVTQQQQRAKETEATAELDNQGLVQLQQQVMQQQDHELEQMEKTVISTKVGSRYSSALQHP